MNIRSRVIGLALCALACLVIYSCTHVSGTFISAHGSMAGRSMKDNCMDCHQAGATQGAFSVAGTVLQMDYTTRNPNGTVYLYSQPNASLGNDSVIATIEVDGVGNFYTTHPIDLSKGVYPAVTSASGNKVFMKGITTNGSCNSCHGPIESNIVVN